MEDNRLVFFALLFIAAVSVIGLVSLMNTNSTAYAWGNMYDTGNDVYRNCYCHSGTFMYSQPRNPGSGIYGPEVRFLGKLTENQCEYECISDGYSHYYWVDPDANTPVWPRRSW